MNFSTILIVAAYGLSGATPLFLTQKALAASPADEYVSTAGTDSGDCSTLATPCKTITYALTQADTGTVINVAAGTYTENVNVNKAVALEGASAANTTIVATDGNSTPLTFNTNDATVSGFTITHNYTPAELSAWNFNNNGVTFGQLTSGNTLENSTVSLSRNGIYINRSQNNIINNTITDNRTGINATNTINGTQITGNTISDNWTLGFVYYDSGYSTDFDTVTMTGNTFDNNWYTQVEVKTAAGSTGTLDVTNNTFSDSPVTYTTSSDASWNEPGFVDQQPVELGGSAVKPATAYPTLRIYSSGSVILKHTPKTLRVGASEPYATIQAAVADASAGDTIAVDPGTYSGDVNIPVNDLTIAGTGSVILNLGSGYGINLDSPPTVTTGFTMSGITVDASTSTTYAFKAYKADGLTLTNDTFNGGVGNTGGGVDFNTTNDVTLNNVTSTGFHKNGFAYTAQYLSTDTPANGITFNGVTASDDGWAGIAFYTMNGSNTSGHSISGVTFSGNNSLTGDGQGLFVEGDSDANHISHTTPQYQISGSGNAPVDLGDTAFSGNTQDIDNYQTNDLQALSATFGGLTGNNMTAVQHQAEDSSIIDQLDYPSFGLVKYHTTSAPLPAPTNLAPTDGTYTNNDQFDDSWNPVANASKYEYHWSASPTTDGNGALTGAIGWDDSGTYDQSTPGTVIRHNGPTTDGVYYWQVRAYDSEGTPGNWSTVNKVTVDTVAPVAKITAPAAGSAISGTVTVSGTVTDANPDHYYFVVKDSHGNVVAGPGTVNQATVSDWSWNTKNVADGTYTIDLEARDKANNKDASSVDTRTVTVDNTAPVVTVTPVAGSLLHGTETFNITVTDDNLKANNTVWVYLYNSAAPQKSYGANVNLSSGHGTFTVNTKLLDDGIANLDVGKLYDAAGNPSGTGDTYFHNYVIDNSGPTGLANSSPSDGTYTTTAKLTSIDWTDATDPHGPITYYYESSNSSATNAADGSFTTPVYQSGALTDSQIPTTGTPAGVYYWHVRAVDALGNSSDWTSPWKVTVDNTKPLVSITSPTDFSTPFAVGPNVTVNAADPGSGLGVLVIHVYNSSNTLLGVCGSATPAELSAGSMSCDLSGLPDGTYYIKAGANDNAGNNTTVQSANFTIDSTAPSTPTASPDPTNGPFSAAQLVTLTSSDPVNNGVNSNPVSIYYTTDGSTPNNTGNGTLYSAGINVSSSETIEAVAYDNAGNASGVMTASYTITPPVTPTFTTFTFFSSAAGSGGGSGGTNPQGGGAGGTGGLGGGTVLGATTTTPNTTTPNTGNTSPGNSNGHVSVQGTSTIKPNKKSSAFLGLGWWWLLVLAILLGVLRYIFGRRRNDNGQTAQPKS